MWRVGRLSSPLALPSHAFLGKNRFDDSRREFRSLYCALDARTCLREVLADLRPSLQALAEFEETGKKSWSPVPDEWRVKRVLVPATVEILSGALYSLDDVSLRRDLERKLLGLLLDQGIGHLDLDVVQGSAREVTQAIARALFEEGAAGVLYRSKYDNEVCVALFEGRSRLIPRGDALSLAEPLPEFQQVCKEFRLDG